MQRPKQWPLIIAGALFGFAVVLFLTVSSQSISSNTSVTSALIMTATPTAAPAMAPNITPNAAPETSQLLTDPFLQAPTPTSVQVVWFTDFAGTAHAVSYGKTGQEQSVTASTTQLSRTREDKQSHVGGQPYKQTTPRPIWRHAAEITGLTAGERLAYQVFSTKDAGELVKSRQFTLAAAPPPGRPLQILLTSDHQLMPMTAANLQKVQETIGQVDAVFLAGDLVNVPDRASEWFDDVRGGAFFPCLQGRAHFQLGADEAAMVYRGGELIQHAPLFPAVGNHEVMGRYSEVASLGEQFNDPVPWAAAKQLYEQYAPIFNPEKKPQIQRDWLKNNSFNIDTYEEIFSLPTLERPDGGKTGRYYATTFGDVRLVSLYVTQIWRSPGLTAEQKGRYRERQADLNNPVNWGHGQHIFEGIQPESPQYQWLERELQSEAFQKAKFKVVMFHHPPHTLGGNIVPAFTDPVRVYDRNSDGSLKAIRYEYPKEQDYIIRDLIPLLERSGVQLVFYGHSHLWNRFVSASGLHFLESSNVGNSYGAHLVDNPRPVPAVDPSQGLAPFKETYIAVGDPNGLAPVMPTLSPLKDEQGNPLPYIASNDITAFSILDTGTALVSSYYFDTRQPDAAVVKFDQFSILNSSITP